MSLQVGKVPYILLWTVGGGRERERQIHTSFKSGSEKKHCSTLFPGENKLIKSFFFLFYKKQSGGYMYGGTCFLLDRLISPRSSFSLLLPTWS